MTKENKFGDNGQESPDEWEDFRAEDGEPIGTEELTHLDLVNMPEGIHVWVMDNYFPETVIWREGDVLICEIQEHLYTKFWEHKFSAYAFDASDSSQITIEWDFGDGVTSSGWEVDHQFAMAGTYQVTVRMIDSRKGLLAMRNYTIDVGTDQNLQPTAPPTDPPTTLTRR